MCHMMSDIIVSVWQIPCAAAAAVKPVMHARLTILSSTIWLQLAVLCFCQIVAEARGATMIVIQVIGAMIMNNVDETSTI